MIIPIIMRHSINVIQYIDYLLNKIMQSKVLVLNEYSRFWGTLQRLVYL